MSEEMERISTEDLPDATPSATQNNDEEPLKKEENEAESESKTSQIEEEKFETVPRPATKEEEKKIIDELKTEDEKRGLQLGANYYLISHPWLQNWEDWTSGSSSSSSSSSSTFGSSYFRDPYSSNRFQSLGSAKEAKEPSEIDNTDFISQDSKTGIIKVKDSASENHHFRIISEGEWKTLHSWYGGGPEIRRRVIQYSSLYQNNLKIELNPLTLKLYHSSDLKAEKVVQASKSMTLGEFKNTYSALFGVDPNKCRIVDFHQNKRYAEFSAKEESKRLDDARIMDGQPMLIDEPDEKGNYVTIKEEESSYTSSFGSYYNNPPSRPCQPGTTGLGNLGNTCFMNSSVQCLSHTSPLIDYFTKNLYVPDINTNNPLGSGGVLANTYAALIKELWSGRGPSYAPREFKRQLELFAPQFAGYQQHDSQELLAFLLDGIHEDVNKVRNKPYVENPEVGDRKESEVADEAWAKHKSRNQSVIVDYFQGQLKSTLVCPDCDRVSITFDPFMYLSLPIPVSSKRTIFVTVCFLANRVPVKYACQVPKNGTIAKLRDQVSILSNLNPESFVLAKMDNKTIDKHYERMDDSIDNIWERSNVYAFEIDPTPDTNYYPVSWKDDRGFSFILGVKNGSEMNYEELYTAIYNQIRRVLKVPSDKVYRTVEEITGQTESSGPVEPPPVLKMSIDNAPNPRNTRNVDSSSEDEAVAMKGSDTEEEDVPVRQPKKKKNVTPLFVVEKVPKYRSYWSSSDDVSLTDDGKPLNLPDRTGLQLVMDKSVYKTYFDRDADSAIEEHETTRKARMDDEDEWSNRRERPVSLTKCIDLFSEVEKLGPDDPWYCSKCKEMRRATKKFDLWKLPPILVVHLKRFYHRNRFHREKLDVTVDFPITGLDLSQFVQGPYNPDEAPIYDLYAVSNHYGSLGGGHYTALAKNRSDKEWYKFDDSHVSKTSEDNLIDSSAYVLFYQRRDIATKEAADAAAEQAAAAASSAAAGNQDESMEDGEELTDELENMIETEQQRE